MEVAYLLAIDGLYEDTLYSESPLPRLNEHLRLYIIAPGGEGDLF